MTSEQQLQIFDDFTAKMREVLVAKANDYAGDVDRLRNFKQVGDVTGIGAPRAVLTHIATKVSRLGTLLGSGKAPSNESVGDSVLDLANYSILLYMVLVEGSAQKAEVGKGYTFLEALNLLALPESYRELILANVTDFANSSLYLKPSDALNDAFVWEDTPQGEEFWDGVYLFLNGKSTVLPPIPEKKAEPVRFKEAFEHTLSKLPKEYAEMAAANVNVQKLEYNNIGFMSNKMLYSLTHAFDWYHTPQGEEFWKGVQEFLLGKRSELPPIPDNKK